MDPFKAYRTMQLQGLSGRALEAQALLQATQRIRRALTGHSSLELQGALNANLQLWQLFEQELGQAHHPLTEDLRKDLLELARFIRERTQAYLESPASVSLDSILDINLMIAKGLSGVSPEASRDVPS